MYPVFRITDSGGLIGTYRAKNEKQAILCAQNDLAQTAATFRRSQPAVTLRDITVKMIEDAKGNRLTF